MSTEQYDTLTDQQITYLAQQLLQTYPSQYAGQIRLLCRSENATFKITTARHRYAMRIHRCGYHNKNNILSELAWLNALRETGIIVPEAIAGNNGDYVQTITSADGTIRHAVLFHWIDGDMPTSEVNPESFQQLGAITAHLHQQSRQWDKPDYFDRLLWNFQTMVTDQSHWGRWQDAPNLRQADHPIIEESLQQVYTALHDYGQDANRFGLIHADLRLTNLLLHEGETRVIDFDDCGMGWYMHDLAAAISFNEHLPNAQAWVENWITGYERIGHLTQADIDIIPAMIIQRRIQMLAWTGTHAETEMTQSLGHQWADESVRLCRKFLETQALPVGI
ncbi:serine/threonine protein kinase [Vibrio aerogenes CECT 7868]|uniref:Serine/threonine protein kinase n=1 Tax=Vibrio aerogenes CECT 7868 TaxID=1216006 RepID=A0A1M5Z8Q1_9VIBR|nr:phosphotransferase [Vibrio aerogenes]SHI20293.1 serine/threonine protein kinase [Vibrio aerogenes CECT 7868]